MTEIPICRTCGYPSWETGTRGIPHGHTERQWRPGPPISLGIANRHPASTLRGSLARWWMLRHFGVDLEAEKRAKQEAADRVAAHDATR